MNKKEQRIVNVFNEIGIGLAQFSKVECSKILKNGVLSFFDLARALPESKFNSFFIEKYFNRVDGGLFQPKELKGIENNNGWIRIESEADLPKKDELYFVLHYGLIVDAELWEIELNFNSNKTITHYHPIIKPNPPIY